MDDIRPEKINRIVRRVAPESRLQRAWVLEGGVSAEVLAVEIVDADGATRRLVIRRHGPRDLAANPHIAADEFRLLTLLVARGLPVPTPHLLDVACDLLPTPYLVVGYLEGETCFTLDGVPDGLSQLAAHLARIHAITPANTDLDFMPEKTAACARKLALRPERLDDSIGEEAIRAALEAAWPPAARNSATLLHGDYWPGNLLWREGRLVGILDWEDAAWGDPLADLGFARLEVLWAYGAEAMRTFTTAYLALTGADAAALPVWDLVAALRSAGQLSAWAGDVTRERVMRERLAWFVRQALTALSSG